MVREAALRTNCSCGRTGVDANGFRRMLVCKSFKKASTGLWDAIAVPAKRLVLNLLNHSQSSQFGKPSYPTRQKKWRSSADWFWRSDQENNRKVREESDKATYH